MVGPFTPPPLDADYCRTLAYSSVELTEQQWSVYSIAWQVVKPDLNAIGDTFDFHD